MAEKPMQAHPRAAIKREAVKALQSAAIRLIRAGDPEAALAPFIRMCASANPSKPTVAWIKETAEGLRIEAMALEEEARDG